MQINGTDIFLGAYAERRKSTRPETLSVSEERAEEMKTRVKESFYSLHLQDRAVKVSVSKEDMDFLCSEEGFQKMKQDAQDLYLKNKNHQKVIAQGRDQDDPFWTNTGNQWMIFSEMLYKNGFYTDMEDEQVKQFEDTLASATFGMDCLSKSQYLTGIEFSSVKDEYKFFLSSGEAATELESSTAALRYMSDRFLPNEQKEAFDQLIDQYYKHNNEVLAEYSNPMESFQKVVAGLHGMGSFSREAAKNPVGEYLYIVKLGSMQQSGQEKGQYRKDLQNLFAAMGNDDDQAFVWEKIKERFQTYATGGSSDGGFRNYVYGEAQTVFAHMKNCWDRLLELHGKV